VTSEAKRDPRADHLITPENAALLVMDYQPSQVGDVRSMDSKLMVKNVVSTVKTAKAFGLPIVHSTVNVSSGRQKPTGVEAHRAGLERVTLAGGQPISWVSLACELQRDWARVETVPQVIQIVLTERLLKE
jgi:nicotinamidase-related amidase